MPLLHLVCRPFGHLWMCVCVAMLGSIKSPAVVDRIGALCTSSSLVCPSPSTSSVKSAVQIGSTTLRNKIASPFAWAVSLLLPEFVCCHVLLSNKNSFASHAREQSMLLVLCSRLEKHGSY